MQIIYLVIFGSIRSTVEQGELSLFSDGLRNADRSSMFGMVKVVQGNSDTKNFVQLSKGEYFPGG
jgi:hypothetical protein